MKRRSFMDEFKERQLRKIAYFKMRPSIYVHAIREEMVMNGELEAGERKKRKSWPLNQKASPSNKRIPARVPAKHIGAIESTLF